MPIGEFHPIAGERPDLAALCADYTARLKEAPIDLICLGIGENGHLAFNDPPVADFNDPALIKQVELDDACRRRDEPAALALVADLVPELRRTGNAPVGKAHLKVIK